MLIVPAMSRGLFFAALCAPSLLCGQAAAPSGTGSGFELPEASSLSAAPTPAPATGAPASVPPQVDAAASAPAQAPVPAPTPEAAPPPPLDRLSVLGTAPVWSQLAEFDKVLTRDQFELAMREVYRDNSPFPPPWQVTAEAVIIPTGRREQPQQRIEFKAGTGAGAATPKGYGQIRYWKRAADLPKLDGRPPLSDIHIALDAGHIGGNYAVMEERFLSFKPGEAIQEGNMSLVVAQVLAERLKKLGAYVTLVRENHEPVTQVRPNDLRQEAIQILQNAGITLPQDTYQPGMGDARVLTVQYQTEKLFYRVSEIHARAQKVNQQIKPDLVLCLHFNAESWGDATAPQFSPKNHFHVLVNGCYSPNELQQQDVRFELMQRVFAGIHEEELPLAESVAEGVASTTGLPAYVYTTPNARRSGMNSYVYARNLLANRLYQCPVVYLEPYVMNHEETYRRLLLGHYLGRTLIGGRLQTSAMEDYVQGVVKGLLAYYQNKRTQS